MNLAHLLPRLKSAGIQSLFLTLLLPLPLVAQITMFPGDCNNDGTADQYDILPIGIAYQIEGSPRPDATLEWVPQLHPDPWGLQLPVSGVDLTFVDSDGNGIIDSFDLDPIALNFDSIQNQAMPLPLPYLPPDTCFSCPKPKLVITFDRDTAMVKDTFYAELVLVYEEEVPPSVGALGIAFGLNYDPLNVVDSLTSVFPDTMPGDLMFVTSTSSLARSWRVIPPGQIRFGAAGKGTNRFFATRLLGRVELVVEDMIIRLPMAVATDFWLEADGILILNQFEQVVCLDSVVLDTLVLFDPVNAVKKQDNLLPYISFFPNPANDWIQVLSPNGALIQIEIWSLDGQLERQWRNVDTSEKLLFQGLEPGVHLLKMYTPKGVLVEKMVVEQ
ncbi:MAG: T9SS type A sorting domain-containing protein [Saprospiraceae bacterium]|nr:T9SS type A sorting domain-containing protein [Saprospiraceae bacterium]